MTPLLYVLKSLHLIFAFTWFAALFYAPRLFIYQTEAKERDDEYSEVLIDQYKLMTKRLWNIIAWPSLILNVIFGLGILSPYFSYMPMWLIVKLVLIVLLIGYHLMLHLAYKGLQKNIYRYTSQQLRLINEVSTFFLFAIVFLGVMKATLNFTYFVIGMVLLIALLYVGIIMYKKKRNKK